MSTENKSNPTEGTPDRITVQSAAFPPAEKVVEDAKKPTTGEGGALDSQVFNADNASLLGGEKFDQEGNLLDTSGEVILKKEEITDKLEEVNAGSGQEAITYHKDENGNLVDNTGKVIAKEGEYEVGEDGEVKLSKEEESSLDILIKKAEDKGFSFEDQDGNPIEFDESDEGFFNMANHIGQQTAAKTLNNLFSNHPDLGSLYNHLAAGGKASDFYNFKGSTPNYDNVDIKDDNPTGQLELIKEYYTKALSVPEGEADYILEGIKAGGDTAEKYKTALEGLKNWSKKQEADKTKRDQDAIAAQQKAAQKQNEAIKGIIKDGKIDSFVIPEKERNTFASWLLDPTDDNGNTNAVKAYEALPEDKKLVLDYLLYKDFDLDKLIERRAKQLNVEGIKKRKNQRIVLSNKPVIKKSDNNPDHINPGSLI
jgi:hypothetical protein